MEPVTCAGFPCSRSNYGGVVSSRGGASVVSKATALAFAEWLEEELVFGAGRARLALEARGQIKLVLCVFLAASACLASTDGFPAMSPTNILL